MRLTGPPTWVMTGVVSNPLKATVPVRRSERVIEVGCTVTICRCDIWSCGTLNSSGLVPAVEGFSDGELLHAASKAREANNGMYRALVLRKRILMAKSLCLPTLSTAQRKPDNSRVPAGKRAGWRDSFVPHRENPTGWRHRAGRRTC